MEMRNELSNNEKIARAISGIDSDATFIPMDTKSLDQMIEDDKRAKWNESVDKIEKKFSEHENKLQEAADEYAKNLNGVQIMPIGNYVIVRPFTENPFQKVQIDKKTGLILSTGGLIPEYKRNDSGEFEEAEQMIKVGIVIQVGPDCKWLKNGDTIMWAKQSEVVVPFYNFGFKLVNETRAICVINDDLNERFNLED
jgi:hypothetical protein